MAILVFGWLLFAVCCFYFVWVLATKATDRITFLYLKLPMLIILGSTIVYILCCQCFNNF